MLRKDWMKSWMRRSGWLIIPALLILGANAFAATPPVSVWSAETFNPSGLNNPGQVVQDTCGNLYEMDSNDTLYEIPASGGAAVAITSTEGGPLAIDSSNNLYTSSYQWDGKLLKIPSSNCVPQASAATEIASPGAAEGYWYFPDGIAVDKAGNVFFTTGSVLAEYTIAGALNVLTSSDSPTYVTVDANDNVYFTDGGDGNVYEIAFSGGTNGTYAATPTAISTSLADASGLAFDAAGDLFVVDSSTHIIYEIPYDTSAGALATSVLIPVDPNVWSAGKYLSAAQDGKSVLFALPSYSGTSLFEMTPGSANFGSVAIGSNASATVSVTFNAAETPAAITFGSNGAITSTGGTCATGTAYSAGQSCTITAKFSPSHPGVSTSGVTLSDASNNVLATAYLQGTGLGAGLTLDSGTVTPIGSGFVSPESIAVSSNGGFIADPGNNAVLYFATPTSTPVDIGSNLSKPAGVAIDGAGNVIIADTGNDRIVEVPMVNGALSNAAQFTITPTTTDSNNNVVPAPIAGKALSNPAGVTIDGQGNLYIADTGNNRVVFIPYNGGWNFAAASVMGSDLNGPLATTVDPWGNLYVADSGDGQIYKFPAPFSSGEQQLVAVGFSNPSALATDASGSLFVADQGAAAIYRIPSISGALDPNAAIQVGFGIAAPYGVALDNTGDLYVTDSANAAAYQVDRTSTTEDFGSWAVNSPSGPLPVQLENEGNQSLVFNTPFNTASGDTGDFSLGTPSNACADGATVAPGAGCEMDAIFQPTASGTRTETLVLSSNAQNASTPQVVLTGSGSTATATTTSLAITSPATGSPAFGQPITLAATVTSSGGTPTGGAELIVDGTITAQATLSSGGVATFTLATGLTGGSHSLQAVYMGTSSFSGSSSTVLGVTVSTAATTSTLTIAVPNTNPYSVVAGGSATLTVTVNFVGVGIPTGTVTFVTGSTTLGTASVVPAAGGTFQATLSTTALPLGSNMITATYSGDANYVGSSVSGGPVDVVSAPTVIATASGTAISTSGSSSTGVTFTNTSYGGWQGVVGYHCDPATLPANAICVFSPGQVPVMASTSSVTYPTATTTLSVLVNNPPNSPAQSSMLWWLGGLTGFSLLFVRRRMMRGAWGTITMLIAAVLLAGSASGLLACSSGASFVTPSGTSTVTVYASADPYATSADDTTKPCGVTGDPTSAPCSQQSFQVSLTVK